MTRKEKEALLTEEDLANVTEHRFYVNMSLSDRLKIRDNMLKMKKEHRVPMTEFLRVIMLKYMNDDEFLKYVGLIKE